MVDEYIDMNGNSLQNGLYYNETIHYLNDINTEGFAYTREITKSNLVYLFETEGKWHEQSIGPSHSSLITPRDPNIKHYNIDVNRYYPLPKEDLDWLEGKLNQKQLSSAAFGGPPPIPLKNP